MKILVTGTAGFIGFFVAKRFLELGHIIVGVDNVNDYYDVSLKEARLDILKNNPNFVEVRINIEDKEEMTKLFATHKPQRVVNLAAQAGVRYSLEQPHSYVDSNITGFLNILEGCRHSNVEHLVFASTASVYGANAKMPWSEHDACNHQLSLYAATKKANEAMAHSYSHLFKLPITGLRFFNAYGPWGRPDMALFMFVKNIIEEKQIDVYNHGNMIRDFTYVEDIAKGVVDISLAEPSKIDNSWQDTNPDPASSGVAPFRIYNIGNNSPVELMEYIKCMEEEIGKKAIINYMDIQPGEVVKSWANNDDLAQKINFKPQTNVKDGVKAFVNWYRAFYGA